MSFSAGREGGNCRMADPRQRALAYLNSHHVMTLATVGEGLPWAAAVFYVNEGFDIFFLSASHTRHARHLATQPRAAGAIHEDYHDWQVIQGIQLEGAVEKLSGPAQAAAQALYQARYPFIAQGPPEMAAAWQRVSWYRLRPDRLYFVDNSQGFGHRDLILGQA